MKKIYSSIQALDAAKLDYEVDALFGTSGPSNPRFVFCDEPLTVFSEQWAADGHWRGWLEEKLQPKEYFKRKLKGK